MNFIFGIPITTVLVVGTVVVLSVIYVATAAAGVEKGSALVSNANVIIAAAVVVFLFLAGPTVDILNNLMEGTGVYLLPVHSRQLRPGEPLNTKSGTAAGPFTTGPGGSPGRLLLAPLLHEPPEAERSGN